MPNLIFPLLIQKIDPLKETRHHHIRFHQGAVLGAIDIEIVRASPIDSEYDIRIQIMSNLPNLSIRKWHGDASSIKSARKKRTRLFKLAREAVKEAVSK